MVTTPPLSSSPADRFEFDVATVVSSGAQPGQYVADVRSDWGVGTKPNGGYLLTIIARAVVAQLAANGASHRDPLAATAHFVAAPQAGPATIAVTVLRIGRSASQARATLIQGDRVCVDAAFTVGTLDDPAGEPYWSNREPLQLPPIGQCFLMPADPPGAPPVSILEHVDLHMDPAVLGFAMGEPSGNAELRGWLGFTDGRPIDALSLLFMADVFPPATFELLPGGWAPTLTLTVYVRSVPTAGPLRARQAAQVVRDDRFDEVCELWDSSDRLVAHATQIAGIRLPEPARQ